MTVTTSPPNRRAVLQAAAAGALGLTPALRAAVYAAGSDAPEKTEVKIGFIHNASNGFTNNTVSCNNNNNRSY